MGLLPATVGYGRGFEALGKTSASFGDPVAGVLSLGHMSNSLMYILWKYLCHTSYLAKTSVPAPH